MLWISDSVHANMVRPDDRSEYSGCLRWIGEQTPLSCVRLRAYRSTRTSNIYLLWGRHTVPSMTFR